MVSSDSGKGVSIIQTLSELWSILFFKSLIPFCISEKLSSARVQLLTIVPAIYVVVLVITILLVVMDLHARNYKISYQFSLETFSLLFKQD